MKTLGLDVSPLRIGWAIVNDDLVVDHDTITFKQSEWVTPGMRSEALEDALDSIEDIHQIGLEAVFVGPNKLGSIRAAMALGQVESICDYLWPSADQKILTAAQWRSHCGITQGGKEPVMEWARSICKDSDADAPATQDAADAVAIAYATMRWFSEAE